MSLDKVIPVLAAEVADAETVLPLEVGDSCHSLRTRNTVSHYAESELYPACEVAAVAFLYRVLLARRKGLFSGDAVLDNILALASENFLQAVYMRELWSALQCRSSCSNRLSPNRLYRPERLRHRTTSSLSERQHG